MLENENKISYVLKNFIEELSKSYNMTLEEKEELEKIAENETTKLHNKKDDK